MVEEEECTRDGGGSHQLGKMGTLVGSSQQRRCVGYGRVEMGRGGEGRIEWVGRRKKAEEKGKGVKKKERGEDGKEP